MPLLTPQDCENAPISSNNKKVFEWVHNCYHHSVPRSLCGRLDYRM